MDVKLPKLGEGAESGTVVSILVKEGDQIEAGQTILELENEKAVAPIPSTSAGVVQAIRAQVGATLTVGQIILTLGSSGESGRPQGQDTAQKQPDVAPAVPERPLDSLPMPAVELDTQGSPNPVASPSIRRLGRELGLDLRRIKGGGRGGRIEMADLRRYVEGLQQLAFGKQTQPTETKAPPPQKPEQIDFAQFGPVTRKALTALRQTISRRMTETWNSIPHVTQFDEADITDLNALRKQHAQPFEAQGAKLTLTPLLVKAVVATLQKNPPFNASLDEASHEVVFKEYYHIGLAVDTSQGLLVPVIRDADKKSLLELALEINELAIKARDRKLSLEEMRGGTFTISNQGGIGGGSTPIINKPEVAILGLGRGVIKPVWRDGQVQPRLLMPLGLSYDHRLIDGGSAARFTSDLNQALQSFSEKDFQTS